MRVPRRIQGYSPLAQRPQCPSGLRTAEAASASVPHISGIPTAWIHLSHVMRRCCQDGKSNPRALLPGTISPQRLLANEPLKARPRTINPLLAEALATGLDCSAHGIRNIPAAALQNHAWPFLRQDRNLPTWTLRLPCTYMDTPKALEAPCSHYRTPHCTTLFAW